MPAQPKRSQYRPGQHPNSKRGKRDDSHGWWHGRGSTVDARPTMAQLQAEVQVEIARMSWRVSPIGYGEKLSRGKWRSAPHLDYIADKLIDLALGIIKRLIICVPPRFGKSFLSSWWLPVWYLDHWPHKRIMLCGYGAHFASGWGRRVRRTIEQNQGLLRVRIDPRSRGGADWVTTEGGGMKCTGVDGQLTGEGADLFEIDDPHKNRREANSPVRRQAVWEWWQSTVVPRLEPDASAVIIMQRWHRDDLVGRIKREMAENPEATQWEIIELPALARDSDPLGRKPGEPLWPARWPMDAMLQKRVEVGPAAWASQYQQDPRPAGGAIFDPAWWADARYDYGDEQMVNKCLRRWISFDTAETVDELSENAYTSYTVGELLPDYRLVIRKVWRGRPLVTDLQRFVEEVATEWNRDEKLAAVIIENKSSGRGLIAWLKQRGPAWLRKKVRAYNPTLGKEERAQQAAGWCEQQMVLLPDPHERCAWLPTFQAELFDFPASDYKDQVDGFVQLVIFTEARLLEGWRARQRARARRTRKAG